MRRCIANQRVEIAGGLSGTAVVALDHVEARAGLLGYPERTRAEIKHLRDVGVAGVVKRGQSDPRGAEFSSPLPLVEVHLVDWRAVRRVEQERLVTADEGP